MEKEKLQVYIDLEHRQALEELKNYLPVDEKIKGKISDRTKIV